MTIGDKCPYCGSELFSGYLQSARQIIWSQEEKSISFRADEDGDLVVSHGIWEGSFADCRYCTDCGIFLLERPSRQNSASVCTGNSAACAAAKQRNKKRPHAAFCRVRFVVFQKDQTLKRKSVTSPSCMT